MSKFIEAEIECPFYVKEGKSFIECEGLLDDTECIHRFKDDIKKREYEEKVCSVNCGRKCQHYRSLSILYERGLKS